MHGQRCGERGDTRGRHGNRQCCVHGYCESLRSVKFGGTVAQRKAVGKGNNWKNDVPAKSVKCSDGEAEL